MNYRLCRVAILSVMSGLFERNSPGRVHPPKTSLTGPEIGDCSRY